MWLHTNEAAHEWGSTALMGPVISFSRAANIFLYAAKQELFVHDSQHTNGTACALMGQRSYFINYQYCRLCPRKSLQKQFPQPSGQPPAQEAVFCSCEEFLVVQFRIRKRL